MKRKIALLLVLGMFSVAISADYWAYTSTTAFKAADTNSVDGSILIYGGLNVEKHGGVSGYVLISDLVDTSGDTAVGNTDTAIVSFYCTFGLRTITWKTDTVVPPDTIQYYNDDDSIWRVMDNFYIGYTIFDSVPVDSIDSMICTLTNVARIFEE